jgi:phosphatidylglycerol:prolipoprotein diacylglycerol transferase
MYPILFKVGHFTVHTYGVLHALAYGVAIWWAYRYAKREGIDPQRILDLSVVIFIWSVIGSRVFSILFDGNLNWYLQNPLEMLKIWKGGLTFYGGFLFSLASGVWFVRKHRLDGWKVADLIAPGLALGIAIGRLGCLASGDSYGKPTSLPWGITFSDPHGMAPTGIPLHPTQLYSVVVGLVIFAALLWWQKRKRYAGELFILFMVLYAALRSVVEIFRDDPRGVYFDGLISTSQIVSAGIALLALVLYLYRRKELRATGLSQS